MSKMKLSGKALVLQIDRYQLRIAKLICGAAAPQVQATHVVDLPEGTVEDGMIRDIETLVSILKNALEAPEFKHIHRAVILLCTSQVISDQTQVPNMSGARLDKVLTDRVWGIPVFLLIMAVCCCFMPGLALAADGTDAEQTAEEIVYRRISTLLL